MHEAKTTLSRLVARAEHGEEIVITRHGTPAVRLTPVSKSNRMESAYGSLPTDDILPEELDELPDEIADALGLQ